MSRSVPAASQPSPLDDVPAPAAASVAPEAASRPTGAAAAAILAAGLGVLALGGAHLAASAYGPFEEALLIAGRFFLPGGAQLVTYGGKELVLLAVWLGSWAVLHWRLRGRQVGLTPTAGLFLIFLVLGTLLLWPPITYALARLVH